MHKALAILSFAIAAISLIINFKDLNTTPENESFTATSLKPASKYWLLSDYSDSILQYRSIAKYSDNPLTWNAVVLRLEEDSLHATGILGATTRKLPPKNIFGKIAVINEYGDFSFNYNPVSKKIVAVSSREANMGLIINTYKPVSESEYLALFHPGNAHPLQEGMNRLFVKAFFAGEYQSLDRKPKPMTLAETGEIQGFQKFTKYTLQDYFGTSHPFNGLDAIWLENKSGTGNYYNWIFSGDTLTLTEMKLQEETYFPGTKSWKFVRVVNY